VLIETTTLDIRSGEPAISHVRAAFATGTHVVTANKGPVAFAYRALADEAAAAGVEFFFEGAVMDGIPIFNLVRETMPAVTIRGFRGVVNSTTNYLLTALERGESFERALADMQAAGVAEADPSLDVDGWDAAAKAAALANVWLDAHTTPIAIPRAGIGPETAARAQAARAAGRRLKLVARGSGLGRNATVGVALEEVEPDDPLAILDGQANALELDTWPLGKTVIMQRGGGLEKTAYALLTDLIAVARRIQPR
jgi:homoserine dehydrogenase